ncbi:PREDICTED: mitochondrial fission factor homolog A-like isoform X1 [Crocodylus porosus]|uniref:mitochondrial fission factor homolog A-like isoform X1 n=1 Tax=Crocodylus porosus TaxID=8502 RepID=UPI00093D4016|nr:PREDICTED: mitochondrial fission factor homolog A-like isoform X1 [Crocodylus porosus]XP_019395842.1 PREDICTED: mitochondrial fission factor homolog A-like isoform X1 [Crocodylus porosus]
MMWPFWSLDLNRIQCDLGFTEAISQSMQVPNRLKVAEEPGLLEQERTAEDVPPSFQMHIPDRLSLTEIIDAVPRPLLVPHDGENSSVLHEPLNSSTQPSPLKELPFLNITTRSAAQKRKRLTYHVRSQRERPHSENAQLPWHSGSERHDRPNTGLLPSPTPQFPLFMHSGRIYSLQNFFQIICFLSRLLFHQVQKSLQPQAQPSSQEAGPTSESSLEEIGMSEIIAMRKQLNKISGRLRNLEEQCTGWHQKELLVYSVLVSACLLNTWLWLRR